jgi:hypothetical protein
MVVPVPPKWSASPEYVAVIVAVTGVKDRGDVKVTEQLPETRAQDPEEKLPPESELKLTVPVGAIAPPTSESVTVTVQVVLAPGKTEEGEHETDTETALAVAVTVSGEAELAEWSASPR